MPSKVIIELNCCPRLLGYYLGYCFCWREFLSVAVLSWSSGEVSSLEVFGEFLGSGLTAEKFGEVLSFMVLLKWPLRKAPKFSVTFESLGAISNCHSPSGSYWTAFSLVLFIVLLAWILIFLVGRWNPKVSPFKRKLMNWYWLFCCMIMINLLSNNLLSLVLSIVLHKLVLTFESVDEILNWGRTEQYFRWHCLLCCTKGFFLLSLWMKS